MSTMVVSNMIKSYTVIVHEAEEGGYWGEVLELPGCVSQGDTMEEFRRNIREALEAVLESDSQTLQIEISTEPALDKKEYIQFEVLESREENAHWVEVSGTRTAIA